MVLSKLSATAPNWTPSHQWSSVEDSHTAMRLESILALYRVECHLVMTPRFSTKFRKNYVDKCTNCEEARNIAYNLGELCDSKSSREQRMDWGDLYDPVRYTDPPFWHKMLEYVNFFM